MKGLHHRSGLLAGILMFSVAALCSGSQHTSFSGAWTMDASKSQVSDARAVTLTIGFEKDVMKLTVAAKKGDTAVTSQFACDTSTGAECAFDEGGHKSKASVYFSGPALNICKTGGPQTDAVAQWKLELSPDGKVLTATISHIDPAGKDEVLVFAK